MASIAAKSSQFESSSLLSTPAQWKSALREIKLLYIQKQYKRCVACSSSILAEAREPINPVHKTCLYLYSAVSYEAMGRYAHDYSSKKVPLLHEALDCFVICLAVLPGVVPGENGDGGEELVSRAGLECQGEGHVDICSDDIGDFGDTVRLDFHRPPSPSPYPSLSPSTTASQSRSTSPAESIVTSITDIIEKTLDCPIDDPFLSDYEDGGIDEESERDRDHLEVVDEVESETEEHLMPSPLQVRKSFRPRESTPALEPANATKRPGQSRDLAVTTARERRNTASAPTDAISTLSIKAKIASRAENASVKTYNTSLISLHTQITNTINNLQTLIAEVTASQQARAASRRSFQRSVSFWSFSPVKNENRSPSKPSQSSFSAPGQVVSVRESKAERIARLRAEGWETVGLKNRKRGWKGAEYYRGLCGMALDELYLG